MALSPENKDALQYFETIWSNIESGICIIDAKTREILDINPVAARMFGDDKENIIGKRCDKYFNYGSEHCCPILDEGLSVDRSERRITRPDGQVLPIIKSVAKIRYNDRLALLESFTDISRLKEAEARLTRKEAEEQARFANILNSMDAIICVTDSETNEILFLNDKIRELFGIEGDGVGQLCHVLLQGLDEPCPGCPHELLRQEPDKTITWVHHERVKDTVLHKTARLIEWPGGKTGHLEYAIDITELIKTREALEQREAVLDALNKAAIVLISQQSDEAFEPAITEGCRIISEMARLDRISVWKTSAKSNGLHCSQIYRWTKEAGGSTSPIPALMDTTFAQLAPRLESILAEGKSVNSPVRLLPEAAVLRSFGCVSIFINPIFINNEFWGFVLCDHLTGERFFTEDEADALRSASFMLANAVMRHEEAIVVREANEQVKEQAHWYKSILDAMPIPISVTDTHMKWTLINKAAETMLGKKYEEVIGKPCRNWGTSICGTKQCGIVCAKGGVPRTFFNHNGSSYQKDIGTLNDLDGTLTGFIEVVQDITQVENMMRRQGEMEKNISQLQIEADKIFYDSLTGIYSRRYFEENFERLLGLLSRSDGMLSLMLADIDFFKQYNDTYGHIKGDDCLRKVAEILSDSLLRKDDFVARYGGEEFIIVLPNTDEVGAHRMAGKMLDNVRSHNIPHSKSSVAECVTISLGLVTGRVKYTHRRNDFIKRADEMLYEAKLGGRNRYSFTQL